MQPSLTSNCIDIKNTWLNLIHGRFIRWKHLHTEFHLNILHIISQMVNIYCFLFKSELFVEVLLCRGCWGRLTFRCQTVCVVPGDIHYQAIYYTVAQCWYHAIIKKKTLVERSWGAIPNIAYNEMYFQIKAPQNHCYVTIQINHIYVSTLHIYVRYAQVSVNTSTILFTYVIPAYDLNFWNIDLKGFFAFVL